ncbi:prealbumin-like fold domain-containing protein [Mesorhizobium captivum]|uniref:DUF7927 domain-containing protein n=1 Tax=Mesorhizobium captivum TaxID=3072319 RepID=UPI002A24ABB5|nr:GEVED domain-containing protein [Mesorhizobium sp. VK23E]MDX8512107.1 GEVED domain-containing protein [Mesorhizobium sp. VK23E]
MRNAFSLRDVARRFSGNPVGVMASLFAVFAMLVAWCASVSCWRGFLHAVIEPRRATRFRLRALALLAALAFVSSAAPTFADSFYFTRSSSVAGAATSTTGLFLWNDAANTQSQIGGNGTNLRHATDGAVYVDGIATNLSGTLYGFAMDDTSNAGLLPVDSTTYCSASIRSRLVSINTSTGVVTYVGNWLSGRHISGAAFDGLGRLWALDCVSGSVIQISPSTGAVGGGAISVGSGFSFASDLDFAANGMGIIGHSGLLFRVFDPNSGWVADASVISQNNGFDGTLAPPYAIVGVGFTRNLSARSGNRAADSCRLNVAENRGYDEIGHVNDPFFASPAIAFREANQFDPPSNPAQWYNGGPGDMARAGGPALPNNCFFDWGDAPDSYLTSQANGGARHSVVASGPYLGSGQPDFEVSGQPNADATGDNTIGTNDENGVVLPVMSPGSTVDIQVSAGNVSAGTRLQAWIDWAGDGSFAEAGDQILVDATLAAGANTFSVPVPPDAVVGTTFARVRIANQAGLSFSGPAGSGEVEDYQVQIEQGEVDLSITKDDGTTTYTPGLDATYTIVVTNNGPDAVTGAQISDPLPAGITTASWTCGEATGGAVCGAPSGAGAINTTADLPAGASVTYQLSMGVPASYSGSLTNTATVTAPAGATDSNPSNNSASDTDTMAPPPTSGACSPVRVLGSAFNPLGVNMAMTRTGNWQPNTYWTTFGGNYTITWTFSQPVPANWVQFVTSDIGGAEYQTQTPASVRITLGAGSTATAANFTRIEGELGYTPSTGVLTYDRSGPLRQQAIMQGNSTATVTSITLTASNVLSGDYINNSLFARPACLTVQKVSEGGTGGFQINMSNAVQANGTAVPSTTLTTTTAGTAVSSPAYNSVPGTDLALSEVVPAGWNLASAVCTDQNAGATGNPTVIGSLASPTLTIPGANVRPQSDIQCLFTNDQAVDLAITKNDGSTTYAAGSDVAYNVVVTNNGPGAVTDAQVSDALPAGITTASWTCGSATGGAVCDAVSGTGAINTTADLPAGASVTYRLTMSVPADFTGDLVNTATVTAPAGVTETDTTNNTAIDTDTAAAPKVSVAKTLIGESITTNNVAEPGEVLTYRVRITHTGGSAFNDFDFIENIPNGATMTRVAGATGFTNPVAGASTVQLSVAQVPVGGFVDVEIDLTVAAPIPLGITQIRNLVSGADVPPDCSQCSVTTPTPPYTPNFPETVSCSTPGAFFNTAFNGAGGRKTSGFDNYWQVATSSTAVTGAPPASLTYSAASVITNPPAGWAVSPFGNAGWISTSSTGAPVGLYDSFYRYQFNLDPAVDPSSLGMNMSYYADDGVIQVWVNGVAQNISAYPAWAPNSGATGVLDDSWRSGLNEIVVHVRNGGGPGGFMAQINSGAICQPKITLRKEVVNDNGGTAVAGDFTLRATGQAPLTEVIEGPMGDAAVTNASVPAGTYTLAEDALPGYSASPYSCAVDGGAAVAGDTLTLANGQNAICTVTNNDFVPQKALTGESGVVAGVAEPGETLTYTVKLTNSGGSAALYNLVDNIDDNTTYVAGSTAGTAGTGEPAGTDPLAWSNISIPANSSVTVEYQVTVADPIPAGVTEIGNVAYKDGDPEPDCSVTPTPLGCVKVPTPGTATPVKRLTGESGLVDGVAEPGETLTYTVTLTNTGTAAALYDLTDNIDANTTYVAGSATVGGSAREPVGTDPLAWDDITVPANGTVAVVYRLKVADALPAGVTKVGNIAYKTGDPEPDCTTAPDLCVETPTPGTATPSKQLSGESGTLPGVAEPGETLTYTVTLTNADATAALYDLTDNIDANTAYVAGSATVAGTTREPVGSDPLTWDDITVPANSTVAVTYQVKVADPIPAGVTKIGNVAYKTGDPEPDCSTTPSQCVITPTPGTATPSKALTGESGTVAGTAEPGEMLTYTVTLTNADATAALYDLTDNIDANTAYVAGSATAGGTPREPVGSDPLVWDDITVPANSTVAVTYQVKVANPLDPSVTEIRNAATDDCTANPGACVTIPAVDQADLSITKSNGSNTYVPGADVVYTIVVTNNGPDDVQNALVNDPLPSGFSSASWTCGSPTGGASCGVASGTGAIAGAPVDLPNGASVTFTLTLPVAGGKTGEIINTTTVASPPDSFDPNLDNNTARDRDVYPLVDTTKALTGESGLIAGVAEPGETLTYAVTLTNGETFDAVYDLTDNIDDNTTYVAGSATVGGAAREPAGSDPLTWSAITIPVGGSVVVTYQVKVVDPIPAGVTQIRNAATEDCAAAPDACVVTPTPGTATPSKALTGESGALPGVAEPGETLTYTVTLTNADAAAALYDLADNIDANTTYVAGSATVGGTAREPVGTDPLAWDDIIVPANGTVVVTYQVTVADPISAGVTEIRNIVYKTGDPEPDCATAPTQCVVTPLPGTAVPKKALTGESGLVAGVAEPGETLTYTVTLTNADAAAALYDLTDNIDANTTYVAGSATVDGTAREPVGSDPVAWEDITVPANGTVAVTYQVKVADPIPAGVTKIGNVAYKTGDPEPDCVTAPDQCVETPTPGTAVPTKALTGESGTLPGVAEPGETLTYTVTLTNADAAAALYDLTDNIDTNTTYVAGSAIVAGTAREPVGTDPLTWNDIIVPAKGSVAVTYRVKVADPIPVGVTQIANVVYKTGDPEPDCTTAPTQCVVTPTQGTATPTKALTGESGTLAGVAEPGETLTYTVTLTNSGTAAALYDLTDNIDANTTYVAASATVGGIARQPVGSDPLTWDDITVPANSTVAVTYQVKVADPIPAGVTKIGNIAYKTGDAEPDCATAPAQCVETPTAGTATPSKQLSGESGTLPGVAEPGETLTYTVTLTNSGTAAALYDLTDNIDANTTYVAASATVAGAAREPVGSDPLTWDDIVVPANGTVAVTYQVTVADPIPAGVTQIGNVAYKTGDPEPDCAVAPDQCVEIPVLGNATPVKQLSAESGALAGVAEPGETLTYTVTLTNSGTAAALYDLTDNIDANTTYVAASATVGGTAREPAGTDPLAWDDITVPANSTVAVTYQMKVADSIPAGVTKIGNVAYKTGDPEPDCATAPTQCVETPTPGAAVPAKALTGESGTLPGVAEPGETLTYTVTLTNSGTAAALYDLTDNIDANTAYVAASSTVGGVAREPVGADPLTWDDIVVPANGTVAVTYQVKVADPIPAGVTKIGNVAYKTGDPEPDCATAPTQCVETPTPGVAVPTKQLSGESGVVAGVAEPGETLTYTVTLTNSGTAAALYDLTDNIDANTSYVAASATVGGAAREPSGSDPLTWDDITVPANGTVAVIYQVMVADPIPAGVTKIGNVAYETGDPEPDCATAPSQCVEIPVLGNATPVKQLSAESGVVAGVAEPGETLTYTVTLSNADAAAALYDLTDNIDANTTYVAGSATVGGAAREPAGTDPLTWDDIIVPANGTVAVTYQVKVADPIPAGVTKIGNVAYKTGDPEPDCASAPTQCVETPTPGTAVPSKQLSGESGTIAGVAEPGETLTYTVTLTNADAAAALYDLTDNIDANTSYVAGSATMAGASREPVGADPLAWDDIVVPANGATAVTYQVKVADPIPAGVTKIGNVAYKTGDPEPDCATAPDQCVETPTAGTATPTKQLSAESGTLSGVAEPGETLTYTVTLTNSGAAPALYDLTDNIDANTSYVAGSATVAGAGREPSGSDPLAWDGIVVPANATVAVTYQVKVADPIPAGATEVSNVAYKTGDPEPDCSATPPNCVVTPVPGTAVPSKALTGEDGQVDGIAEPGETLTYTVTLTNSGTSAAIYDLADNIDDHTSYVSGSVTVGGTTREPVGSDPLIWDDIIVPAGSAVGVIYSVKVADSLPADVTEVGNVAYGKGTPEPDCSATPTPPECVKVPTPSPVITLDKSGKFSDENGNGVAEAGETILYTFKVENSGNVPLDGVTPKDLGPTFNKVKGSGSLSDFKPKSGATSISLDPSETEEFTATYTLTQADIDNGAGIDKGVENTATALGMAFSGSVTSEQVESDEDVAVLALPAPVSDISITKIANLRFIHRGEQAPYTIRVTNNAGSPASGLTVVDIMPAGFRYVEGSATVNGTKATPEIVGRQIRFTNLSVPASSTLEIRLRLLALSTAGPGEHVNIATALGPSGEELAPPARAVVEIIVEPVFDCGDIIGKVFDDQNRNGYQDKGEPGLAGARVATVKGWLITTDEYGRFHVACADLPDARIGSNFIMKLDTRTLPTGYRLTTENPRVVRLTAGKMTELNFGASLGRVVRLDLTDDAFLPGKLELSERWAAGIDQLITVLAEEQSVLRLFYIDNGSDPELADARIKQMKELIAERWRQRDRAYPLNIETRVEAGQ